MQYYLKKPKKFDKINNSFNHNDNKIYYEKKLFKLRKEVNKLLFNHHLSKSMLIERKKYLEIL